MWCAQAFNEYGKQVSPLPMSKKSPPVTTPVPLNQSQAEFPPLHPMPASEQNAVSSGEYRTSLPVATQARSWNESVDPNAQHDPHEDWSRTCAMPPHFGHCVRESKSDGISAFTSISFTAGAWCSSCPGRKAPKCFFASSTVSNFGGTSATHPAFCARTSATMLSNVSSVGAVVTSRQKILSPLLLCAVTVVVVRARELGSAADRSKSTLIDEVPA
mmetsp:Transcript_51343/g.112531  ORF Transcript_51343/g.112531 Transcript_51343/m.112531 type:complete len:216 (-) Transcript_51343:379-1026(-)